MSGNGTSELQTASPRSRRVMVVVAIAATTVLITLAATYAIEGLDWFAPQGWALGALAVSGLVAWPRLTRMGRIGAVLLTAGVAAWIFLEALLRLAPEVAYSGTLRGIAIPIYLVAATGFFLLVFGSIRALRGPWWTTAVIAAATAAVWGIGLLADVGQYGDDLVAVHIVAQNYLFAIALVSVIAALIDLIRSRRR